jgi:hypothetical protein
MLTFLHLLLQNYLPYDFPDYIHAVSLQWPPTLRVLGNGGVYDTRRGTLFQYGEAYRVCEFWMAL